MFESSLLNFREIDLRCPNGLHDITQSQTCLRRARLGMGTIGMTSYMCHVVLPVVPLLRLKHDPYRLIPLRCAMPTLSCKIHKHVKFCIQFIHMTSFSIYMDITESVTLRSHECCFDFKYGCRDVHED